jgi:hypothetical protein
MLCPGITGSAAPDVGSLEAFKPALLEARSVSYDDPGAGNPTGTPHGGHERSPASMPDFELIAYDSRVTLLDRAMHGSRWNGTILCRRIEYAGRSQDSMTSRLLNR